MSAGGVDEILNYTKKEEEDYYAVLGVDEHSSMEQIQTEYKMRALQYHPDKNAGDKEAERKFQLLNEAKDVLTTPEKKLMFDKWKNSGIQISYKQWLGMKEHVQQVMLEEEGAIKTSMHWSVPKTKDRMLPGGGGGGVSSGPSSLQTPTPAQRRASEGGANLHWGSRNAGAAWGGDNPGEVVSKFRNYEI